jgi:hypothetical protein
MNNDNPPKLTIVAESGLPTTAIDSAELEKAQANLELGWATREMTANLLRVIRGAGKPYELPQQIIDLGDSILDASKSARKWAIWSAMEETLQSGIPNSFDAAEAASSDGPIAKGALQFVASRLVGQNAQEAAGRREIVNGIRKLERYVERQREKYRIGAASASQAKPQRRKKPKAAVAAKLPRTVPPQQ